MKNLSTVFNLVLLVLVGVLFWLYFGLKKSSDGGSSSTITNSSVSDNAGKDRLLRIAHVNVDTLNAKYQLMLDFKREVESSENSLQAEYQSKANAFQQQYTAYMQKKQAGAISQVDDEKLQKELQAKKDELDNFQVKRDNLVRQTDEHNAKILDIIRKYVADYNKKMHFDYILANAESGTNILYSSDGLDITKDIVSGLNLQYKDSLQKASAVKPR
jgi:outer membrane protein